MKPVVLFLCTGNSARSQMAEAILRHEAGDYFDVHSAGTEPKEINPFAIKVINELGIDMSQQRSKSVKDYLGRFQITYLIVVCRDADQNCPSTWPGMMTRLFWPFEDPAKVPGTPEQKAQFFRIIRDEIQDKIKKWLHQLGVRRRD
jgi:arsenate reductase (thioredoxin)